MKYQCNTCGRIYDNKEHAAICHPDITELDDLKNTETEKQCTCINRKEDRTTDIGGFCLECGGRR